MLAFSDQELRKVDRWLIDAGEIKRRPEVETLQMARDTSAEATRKVPSPLMEAAS
jgi:hypothetical protein